MEGFGEYKHIKTQIAPNRACAMHVPRLNNMFSIYSDSYTFIGKHEKELDEKDLICVTLQNMSIICIKEQHQPYESATRNKKILIVFWLSDKLF